MSAKKVFIRTQGLGASERHLRKADRHASKTVALAHAGVNNDDDKYGDTRSPPSVFVKVFILKPMSALAGFSGRFR